MPDQLQPSQPGPEFSSADVQRAHISPEDAGRIILQYAQQGLQADPVALLAAILKQQSPANSRVMVIPWTLPGVTDEIQQIVGENPLRKHLSIWLNVGTSAFFFLEPGPLQVTAITSGEATLRQARAITIDTAAARGLQKEFIHIPINAVTVMVFAGLGASGILIEGI